MAVQNKQLIFAQEPEGLPVAGRDMILKTSSLDIDSLPLKGGVLTRVIALSLDPTLRNSMRWQPKPYAPLYQKGSPMWGFGIGEVIRSEKKGWEVGQLVYSRSTEFAEYQVIEGEQLTDEVGTFKKLTRDEALNVTSYIGAAGMPGMTAYMSLKEIVGEFKKDSSIFVTSAAGAVGRECMLEPQCQKSL